ncbi:MAG: hypothetical protein GY811_19270, partial [Myxococcales bacterium]|nr:hypothetical protein [Myxococcales bacterium]
EFQYETLDYSEVGLYIREVNPGAVPQLHEGEPIRGRIGKDATASVQFRGSVIRAHQIEGGTRYAVKVDAMENMEDNRGNANRGADKNAPI